MKDVNQILCPIDFSPASKSALHEAARIATTRSAELTVLHVLDSDVLGDLERHVDVKEDEILANARTRLEEFLGENIPVFNAAKLCAVIGHPFEEVEKAAKETGADLCVMGAQGAGVGEDGAGVLATRCVRKLPCKVLLVRAAQGEPFKRIAACIDYSQTSLRAAEQAALIAGQDGAALEIIHIARPLVPGYGDTGTPAGFGFFDIPLPPYPADDFDYTAHTLERMHEFVKPIQPLLDAANAEFFVGEHPNPVHGVVSRLQESGAQLVCLGTRGRSGIRSVLLGTVAEKIIRKAPCSVLAVKPE